MKIIISDLHLRKAFDIYNICNALGYEIKGFSSGSLLERAILSLIYLKKVDIVFNSSIKNNNNEQMVYFPVEEDTTLKFYDIIEKYDYKNLYFNLPSRESFEVVRNKRKFLNFCLSKELPVPKIYKLDELLQNGNIPCKLIIKPNVGSGAIGIKFIDSFEDLLKYQDIDFKNYVIQERLENSRNVEGAFFLFDKGKLVSYYGHKRIRTYPPDGGVTVYSKCKINEELKRIGSKLLEKLNWSGIAMVEFLYDNKSNSYKIIEVNPRAWGSIMLSEFCGSNLITNYIMTAISEETVTSEINTDRYIRWFFPWDLISYIMSIRKIKYFWKFNTKNTCYINFSYSNLYRSVMFTLYNMLNLKNISKLSKKMFDR